MGWRRGSRQAAGRGGGKGRRACACSGRRSGVVGTATLELERGEATRQKRRPADEAEFKQGRCDLGDRHIQGTGDLVAGCRRGREQGGHTVEEGGVLIPVWIAATKRVLDIGLGQGAQGVQTAKDVVDALADVGALTQQLIRSFRARIQRGTGDGEDLAALLIG